jgi:hypothetical protein
MKKTVAVTMAVLFALTVVTVSFAGEKKRTAVKPVAKKAMPAESAVKSQRETLTGKVISVNTAAQTITVIEKVKGKEEKTLIILDEKTGITMGKQKKTLEDIKSGDEVSVRRIEIQGKNIAKEIDIMPVKAPKKQ